MKNEANANLKTYRVQAVFWIGEAVILMCFAALISFGILLPIRKEWWPSLVPG